MILSGRILSPGGWPLNVINIFMSSKNIFCCSSPSERHEIVGVTEARSVAPGAGLGAVWPPGDGGHGRRGRRQHQNTWAVRIMLYEVYNGNVRCAVKFSDFDMSIFTV